MQKTRADAAHRSGHAVRLRTSTVAALLALLSMLALSGSAAAAAAPPLGTAVVSYAPPNTPGPPLDVPAGQLDSALSCSATAASRARDIILVLPPTLFDPGEAYD